MPWQGWSNDQEEVNETRVLAGLLDSVESGVTHKSAQDVINELGISTVDPHQLVNRFIETGFFQDETTAAPGTDPTLLLASNGREAVSQFRAARSRVGTARGARTGLLLWLYDRADENFPIITELRDSPHGWFFGQQFSQDEISSAGRNLSERGLIKSLGTSTSGPVLRAELTARGTTCVETYESDPDEMERSMTGSGNVSIGTINQSGGNNAFASTVGSQTSTTNTLTVGQTAQDLATLLGVIREKGGIPDDEITEADDIENALVTSSTGSEQQATAAVGRAHRFLQRVGKLAAPAIQALFSAAGNYAALRLGMSPQ